MWIRAAWLVAGTFGALITAATAQGQALHDIHENAGIPCTACHQDQQEMTAPPNELCVACHGTMIGDDRPVMAPDPHRSPHLGPDEVPVCAECHRVHGKSEDSCSVCHRGFGFEMD